MMLLTPVEIKPISDVEIAEFLASASEDMRVGVVFDGSRRVYTYLAPRSAHVGSLVLVPGNSYCPEPHLAEVVTLRPRRYKGPLSRVLEVLS